MIPIKSKFDSKSKFKGESLMKISKIAIPIIAFVVSFVVLILSIMSIYIINDFRAIRVKKQLLEIPLPQKTQLVESVSKAGKLSGNGNGMQYFGAILIHSDLTFNELKTYYSTFTEDKWKGLRIEKQKGQIIEVCHGSMRFSTTVDSQKYYIVYLWNFNNSEFLDLDIRGH